MLKRFVDQECERRKVYLPIRALGAEGRGKQAGRIRSLLPFYRNGRIFHNVNGCEELEKQESMFPRSKRDDVLDSCAYLLDIVAPGEVDRPTISYEEYEINCLMRGKKPLRKGSPSLRRQCGRYVE